MDQNGRQPRPLRGLRPISVFAALHLMLLPGCLLLVEQPFERDVIYGDLPDAGWLQFQMGTQETCAFNENGSVWCLTGSATKGRWRLQNAGVRAVGDGPHGTCTVKDSGRLRCEESWEDDFELEGPFELVAGEAEAGCAVGEDDESVCWPEDHGPRGLSHVRAGSYAACGLVGRDRLRCWPLEDSSLAEDIVDGVPIARAKTVDVGSGTACAVDNDGRVRCWGRSSSKVITEEPRGSEFVDVALGSNHACALDEDGEVHCWGDSTKHELAVPKGEKFVLIGAGGDRSCGVTHSGELLCWEGD